MHEPNIAVYGSKTCPDTEDVMELLGTQGISYEFKDVDLSPEFNDYIAGLNGGKRVMPTIRINNETLINPSNSMLLAAIQKAGATA